MQCVTTAISGPSWPFTIRDTTQACIGQSKYGQAAPVYASPFVSRYHVRLLAPKGRHPSQPDKVRHSHDAFASLRHLMRWTDSSRRAPGPRPVSMTACVATHLYALVSFLHNWPTSWHRLDCASTLTTDVPQMAARGLVMRGRANRCACAQARKCCDDKSQAPPPLVPARSTPTTRGFYPVSGGPLMRRGPRGT